MNQNINVKARIKRQLRIAKQNFWRSPIFVDKKNNYQLYFVLFCLFLIPIYPKFSEKVHGNNTYEFYRGNIDESSIIESYYGWESDEQNKDIPILESADSFISVNTILNDERNLEGTNEIIDYEIKPGDSFYLISSKFKVSTNSIYWANNFSKNHILRPWEIIKVPPVSWIIHQVKSGDTISSIAQKYDIEESKILEQNLLSKSDSINIWESLVIPWAKKIIPKPVIKPAPMRKANTKANIASSSGDTWYSFAQYAESTYATGEGKYKLVRRQPQHTFYWWNCTRYVGQYKNVNWWGNANQWLKNAKAKGHKTWSVPTIGSIVVFNWRGYNPRYGHVWIVMEVKWGNIYVSDMNYRKLNEVTYRKVPASSSSIKWYIYVD